MQMVNLKFCRHLKSGSLEYTIYHGQKREKSLEKLQSFDVVLTTYDTLKADFKPQGDSTRARLLQQVEWYRIVLDEAHVIRNRSPHLQCLRFLEAKHRWCLTGTPIQNRLEDLGALVEFLRISPFDNLKIFQDQFVTSVNNEPSERLKKLRLLVNAISLRRTKDGVLGELNLLPPRRIDQPVHLSNNERSLYDLLKQLCIRGVGPSSTRSTFQLILRLRQVCNHGLDLLPSNIRQWFEQNSFNFDDPILDETYCENCAKLMNDDDSAAPACLHQVCADCQDIASKAGEDDNSLCPVCLGFQSKTRDDLKRGGYGQAGSTYRPSSKVKALLYNLDRDRETDPSGDTPIKSIVFSEWVKMLDLVGQALQLKGFSFETIDGQKTVSQRDKSLGTAGVGVDLSAASRVHLLEPNWNPMLEQQALDRVHRLGQTEAVVTTCYYITGNDSVEEYVKQKQRWKRHIASSSFSDTPPVSQSEYMSLLCKDLMTMLQGDYS
jgi:SNF2 family DNA or RNA helicase